jgi:hypothetical protein
MVQMTYWIWTQIYPIILSFQLRGAKNTNKGTKQMKYA